MIGSPYVRGGALVLLAMRPAQEMLGQLRLAAKDLPAIRDLVFDCAERCPRAVYHPGHDLWYIHKDTLDQLFWSGAPQHLFQADIDTLTRWFAQGKDLPQHDFPTSFWFSALMRRRGADWNKDGMQPDQIRAINTFISDIWEAWRDPEYVEQCDALRGATQTEAELDLCDRFNINFYDDVMDPLVVFHDLRMGNILHQMLQARSDDLPLQHMYRVADAYIATRSKPFPASMISEADLGRVRADIWTIRGI